MREIHSNSTTPPSASSDTFEGVKTANCKLYVPVGSKDNYAFANGWSNFVNIIEEEVTNTDSNIEAPKISFVNKKLTFHSSTPGVKYIYKIKAEDSTSTLVEANGAEVELTATYIITAYAKTESATSDASTAMLVWATGTLTDASDVKSISVDSTPLLITQQSGILTVSGLDRSETLEAYLLNGTSVGLAQPKDGNAELDLSAHRGQVVLLRVNGKSAKVLVR